MQEEEKNHARAPSPPATGTYKGKGRLSMQDGKVIIQD
jgi:hypothetical protein